METNNIINIPEGYEIDKEKSSERKIVLRKIERPRTWEEYCQMMNGKQSFYCNSETGYSTVQSKFGENPCIDEFDNKEDAKAFVALSRLRKLRKAWIWDWKPDYKNSNEAKFTIITAENEISKGEHYKVNCSMSFPTEEMRDEFLDCFKDLLEIAKPLL